MAFEKGSVEYLMRRAEDGSAVVLTEEEIVRLQDYGVTLQAEVRYQRRKLQEVEDDISDKKIFQTDAKVIVRELRRLERIKRSVTSDKLKADLAIALLRQL